MVIRGMRGLGDNIFQRAFVKRIPEKIYIDTPWPELYADVKGVRFIKPQTRLRTQAKNIARARRGWHGVPGGHTAVKVRYGSAGIIEGMRRCFGFDPGPLTLPPTGTPPVAGDYVVVRPVTLRCEWRAESRNPRPEYVAEAAAFFRDKGYKVVSVADLQRGAEWLVGDAPPATSRFHHGELKVESLMALIANARAVVGGIGWIVPAAIAAGVPAWFICGGNGGFNAPELVTDKRCMDLSRVGFAVPDAFCRCTKKQHNCDKRITNHTEQLERWANGVCL